MDEWIAFGTFGSRAERGCLLAPTFHGIVVVMVVEDVISGSRAARRTRESVRSRLDRALPAARCAASVAVVGYLERAREACTEGDEGGAGERSVLSARQRLRIEELVVGSADGSLETLAVACGVSHSHIGRTFSVAPRAWIRSRKVEHAKRLIRDERRTSTEIAALTGVSDRIHLSKTFKSIVGMNPTDYRRSCPADALLL